MGKILPDRLRSAAVAWLGSLVLRLWFGSTRVQVVQKQIHKDLYDGYPNGRNLIVVCWHRHIILLLYFFRKLRHSVVMISQSRDGEILAGVGKRLGHEVIRGSSSRGGLGALKATIDRINSATARTVFGTAVDGPLGPPRVFKTGALIAAQKTGSDILPIAISGTRVLTFHKAWDKTIVPLPFSKVIITLGPPIPVPVKMTREELENLRVRTEGMLNDLTDEADRISGYDGGES